MKRHFLLFIALIAGLFLHGQESIELYRTNPPVSINKALLSQAWVGGLNNPQPHMTDLDGDGDTELYIFDKQGHRHLGFQREADGSFNYDPALTEFFPTRVPNWVILRDYDMDGVPDLFGNSDTLVGGILVYKGRRLADGRIAFDRLTFGNPLPLIYFPLSSGGQTQLYVSNIDYPAIDDLDCDGDLDILTFNLGGGYVEFFPNQSQELGYGNDTLIFIKADNCYGGIYESGLSPLVTLASTPGGCATPFQGPDPGGARHAGSTLLTFDNNQDGVKELLLGDVSFTEIVLLENSGDCEDAYFSDQELDYPQSDVPVDIVFFPASFYTDIDQDGVNDFIAAPNQLLNAEDVNVFWYYRNEGQNDAPQPVLQDSQFLVREMIDLGTGSIPVAFDANSDGLMDLVVGNRDRFSGTTSLGNSQLSLFLNVGSQNEPFFELVDENYLEMTQFLNTTNEFAPAFGDLNGDGSPEALIGGQSGQLFFFPNSAAAGSPPNFGTPVYPYMNIDVGQSARPFIVDLNRDGLNDLVIGTRSGRINYYQNQGTLTAPFFNPDVNAAPNQIQLGAIDTRNIGSSLGYAAPVVIDQNGEYLLLTGTNRGQVEAYGDIEGNLDGDFTLVNEQVGGMRTGFRSEITFANFNQNGSFEIVLGNGRGGLEYFGTNINDFSDPTGVSENVLNPATLQIFPNPTNRFVNLNLNLSVPATLSLYDLNGRRLEQRRIEPNERSIRLATDAFPTGVYIIRLDTATGGISKRIIVNH